MKFTAQQIAELVNGTLLGDKNIEVNSFSKIEDANNYSLSFLANSKYESFIYTTKASIVLVNSNFIPSEELPKTLTLIKVENAYESLAKLLSFYENIEPQLEGIEDPVFIHKSAKIGKSVYIGAFTYIAEGVHIGDNVQIHSNCHLAKASTIGSDSKIFSGVKLYKNTHIGANCIVHAGAVIGSDGFGFAPNKENQYQKIAQIGNVIIEDYVEIGSNTTIDRATIGSTIIKKGVKIDNLVQIAHNVEIGENTVIAAQTGIAGSSKIDSNVMIGGQVGIAGHLKIAKGTKIAAQSGISKTIKIENTIIQGSPAISSSNFKRSYILFKNFPQLKKQIEDLTKEINTNSIDK